MEFTMELTGVEIFNKLLQLTGNTTHNIISTPYYTVCALLDIRVGGENIHVPKAIDSYQGKILTTKQLYNNYCTSTYTIRINLKLAMINFDF